ncbi:MAG TPA: hypothetical protein VGI08_01080 [Diaminobutyricibacter sp.]
MSERGGDRTLRFESAFWSIVPPGASEMQPKFTFNARADKLMENGDIAMPFYNYLRNLG